MTSYTSYTILMIEVHDMRISTKVQETMWAGGHPTSTYEKRGPRAAQCYADIYRNLIKLGCTPAQATAITIEAFDAAQCYTFNFREGTPIHLATQARGAVEHPNGKDAEDRAAAIEGRPSRWGTPEFHHAAFDVKRAEECARDCHCGENPHMIACPGEVQS